MSSSCQTRGLTASCCFALRSVLAADVREVYQSICQLFELFLLAVFRSFSDVALTDIVGETPTTGAAPQPQTSLPLPNEVFSKIVLPFPRAT